METRGVSNCGLAKKYPSGKRRITKTQIFYHAQIIKTKFLQEDIKIL